MSRYRQNHQPYARWIDRRSLKRPLQKNPTFPCSFSRHRPCRQPSSGAIARDSIFQNIFVKSRVHETTGSTTETLQREIFASSDEYSNELSLNQTTAALPPFCISTHTGFVETAPFQRCCTFRAMTEKNARKRHHRHHVNYRAPTDTSAVRKTFDLVNAKGYLICSTSGGA